MKDDLISRSALLDKRCRIVGYLDQSGYGSKVVAIPVDVIKGAQAIDAVEARHGRWKKGSGYVCGDYQFFCSFCGEEFWESGYWPKRAKYCPNCGAKMDKEYDHENM